MTDVRVDRLAIRLSGISKSEARLLAPLLGERLGAARFPVGTSVHVDAVRVKAQAAPGEGMSRLAEQIVDEILRQIERSA
ncbi:MAG: hypothetical protein Q7T82_08125 [Armatimonadota bacterium]|nr:hypothetical protein [Armatimonadota bacterium]